MRHVMWFVGAFLLGALTLARAAVGVVRWTWTWARLLATDQTSAYYRYWAWRQRSRWALRRTWRRVNVYYRLQGLRNDMQDTFDEVISLRQDVMEYDHDSWQLERRVQLLEDLLAEETAEVLYADESKAKAGIVDQELIEEQRSKAYVAGGVISQDELEALGYGYVPEEHLTS